MAEKVITRFAGAATASASVMWARMLIIDENPWRTIRCRSITKVT